MRGVRSYVQMQKLRQDKPGARRPSPRRWFRPRSIKKMMVEMEQPFVWPEEPENYDLYVLPNFLVFEWRMALGIGRGRNANGVLKMG